MLLDAIRHRLEALERQPFPRRLRRGPPGDPTSPLPMFQAPRHVNPAVRWFDRGAVVRNASGQHYRVHLPLDELWREGNRHVVGNAWRGRATSGAAELHPELAAFVANFPRRVLFLDLETCGFAGSAVFLIGLLRQSEGGLAVDLLLARDYAEERSILETFWHTAGSYRMLVTFNGKCFDWPMICDRTRLHRLEGDALAAAWATQANPTGWPAEGRHCTGLPRLPAARLQDLRTEPGHCDLLHHARRCWKNRLPNCRLKTLERYVCGRHRADDIPGSQIPEAYHQYVRTGDTTQLRCILDHNALDLVTLLDLAMRIAGEGCRSDV
jgi:uncharacterized protein YprB with RNaseH-like and TPR domain